MPADSGLGFWGGLWGGGGDRDRERDRAAASPTAPPEFSLAELKRAHATLLAHSPSTAPATVEALRRTAELLVWGAKHDGRLVDFFLEAGVLGVIVRTVLGVGGPPARPGAAAPPPQRPRSGPVTVQALQTLAILVTHLGGAPPACYALFSGGHLDAALGAAFDLHGDDEVLGHYVALLKAVGSRLDGATVHFFFHDGAGPDGERTAPPRFPLYAAAAGLTTHPEPLARAAARALTLGIYAIPDGAVQAFIASDGCGRFDGLARHAAASAADVRAALAVEEAGLAPPASASSSAPSKGVGPPATVPAALANAAAALEDELGYAADVLAVRPAVDVKKSGGGGAAANGGGATTPTPRQRSPSPAGGGRGSQPASPAKRVPASPGRGGRGGGVGGEGPATPSHTAPSPPTALSPAAALLADRLWDRLVVPHILEPLAALAAGAAAAQEEDCDPSSPLPRPTPPPPPSVSAAARAALHAAQVLFQAAPEPALAGAVAGALLCGRVRQACCVGASGGGGGGPPPPPPPGPDAPPQPTAPLEARAAAGALAALRCHEDGSLAAAAVHALVAAASSAGVAEGDLEAAGLLPSVRARQRALLGRLVGASSSVAELGEDGGGGEGDDAPTIPAGAWGDGLAAALAGPALPPLAARAAAAAVAAAAPRPPGTLRPTTAAALAAARSAARARLAAAVAGPWAEALPALIAAEWAPTRSAITSGPPRAVSASSAAVAWREGAADACVRVLAPHQPGRPPSGAATGLAALRAAQAAVLAAQLSALLSGGDDAAAAIPPTPPPSITAAPAPADVGEGAPAARAPGGFAARCAVAFSRGAERAAWLAAALPAADAGSGAVPSAVLLPAVGEPDGPPPATAAALSSAPLLGAAAAPDARQPAWLHVEVRPPARGLLRAARAGGSRATGAGLASALVDGHWVLAFPSADAAAEAAAGLRAAAAEARAGVAAALEGLVEE